MNNEHKGESRSSSPLTAVALMRPGEVPTMTNRGAGALMWSEWESGNMGHGQGVTAPNPSRTGHGWYSAADRRLWLGKTGGSAFQLLMGCIPVHWAVEHGITSGTSDTTFGAGDVCSRYQVVYFLWAAAGKPEPKTTHNPFTDVKTSHFFYKAVLWAVENGITSGTSDTTFSPTTPCNRAQVVTFLYKAYN